MRQCFIAVRDHHNRRPHIGHIGVLIPPGNAASENALRRLQIDRRLHQRLHRRHAGIVEINIEEHFGFDQRHLGLDLAANLPRQNLRRLQTALGLVDMRIGLVDDQDIRRVDQFLWHVGVVIVGNGDRQIAHRLAHPPRNLSVGLREALGDHRPVQGQQYPVELGCGLELLDNLTDKMLESLGRHWPGRSRPRG